MKELNKPQDVTLPEKMYENSFELSICQAVLHVSGNEIRWQREEENDTCLYGISFLRFTNSFS